MNESLIILLLIFVVPTIVIGPVFIMEISYKIKCKRWSKERRTINAYVVNVWETKNDEYGYYLKEVGDNKSFAYYGNVPEATYGKILKITVDGLLEVLKIVEITNEIFGTCEISEWNIIDKTLEDSYILSNRKGERIFEKIYGKPFVVGDTIIKTKYLYEEGYSETLYELKDYTVAN